jgi:hypothetical protein
MNSKGPARDTLFGHDVEASCLLNIFGQSNRDTKEADTRSGSLLQAATMLNCSLVKTKVLGRTKGSRVNKLLVDSPPWTWGEPDHDPKKKIVQELYLSTLSRFPTDDEIQIAIAHLEEHRDVGVEDLQWALLNKVEFVVNR